MVIGTSIESHNNKTNIYECHTHMVCMVGVKSGSLLIALLEAPASIKHHSSLRLLSAANFTATYTTRF